MANISKILLLWALVAIVPYSTSADLLNDLYNRFFAPERPSRSPIPNKFDHPVSHKLPRIWLTVASVVEPDPKHNNESIVRAVELHWNAGPDGPAIGDHLELYKLGPPGAGLPASGPIRRYILRDSSNRTLPKYINQLDVIVQRSSIPAPHLTPQGPISGDCLHYYLVYISGATGKPVQALNCVRVNPRWMERDFDLIKNRTLEEIMIPGTHDATSFEKYREDDYDYNVISRFQYTQDENLYAQLAFGIRYVDMRVGAYNLTSDYFRSAGLTVPDAASREKRHQPPRNESVFFAEQLWMVHDINRNHVSLREALGEVRRFLERTTHELLIVDFHRFVNGFNEVEDLFALQARLKHFAQIVTEQLGPFLIPYSANQRANIGDMVRQGKRVVLGYAYKYDPRGMYDSDLFWPAVEHLWANTDQFRQLEHFMHDHICRKSLRTRRPNQSIYFQSMMAELTPTVEGIVFLRYRGLRELAAKVNTHYDHWFRQRYWKCANIVAADFFLGSDLVQIAIDVNRKRFDPNYHTYNTAILSPR